MPGVKYLYVKPYRLHGPTFNDVTFTLCCGLIDDDWTGRQPGHAPRTPPRPSPVPRASGAAVDRMLGGTSCVVSTRSCTAPKQAAGGAASPAVTIPIRSLAFQGSALQVPQVHLVSSSCCCAARPSLQMHCATIICVVLHPARSPVHPSHTSLVSPGPPCAASRA